MAQARESHPGLEFVSARIAHDLICGKDHTPFYKKIGVPLLLPVLPPLLVWVLGIHPLVFLPAAVVSAVLWFKLIEWIRIEVVDKTYLITEEGVEFNGRANRRDFWIHSGGGLSALLLLLAVPVKIIIERFA
ncbi:MAG: hypothetical protein Q8P13_04040 [bacterium]|nr:hypothetical protein [bacterium]